MYICGGHFEFGHKKIPQGWQSGIIRILTLDTLKYNKHQ